MIFNVMGLFLLKLNTVHVHLTTLKSEYFEGQS